MINDRVATYLRQVQTEHVEVVVQAREEAVIDALRVLYIQICDVHTHDDARKLVGREITEREAAREARRSKDNS